MERINAINPDRVQWCCDDQRTTPTAVAQELGIPLDRMQALMADKGGLTFNQLKDLAAHFGRSVLFFLEPGPVDEMRVHTPQFRTLASQKPEMSARLRAFIERVERQRAVFLGLVEDLDAEDRPLFAPPSVAAENIREAAERARGWLGLGVRNSFDSYRAAVEAKGILVFRTNGYAGKWQVAKENPVLGFNLYDATCPVIVVKKQDAEAPQSFTLMHELGHVLLHRTSSIDDESDFRASKGTEREANAFAGHLLVPDAFLASISDAERPSNPSQYDDWLKEHRGAWGVSGEVILLRLLDKGRIDQAQYAAYRAWRDSQPRVDKEGGSREYRHREPKHVFGDRFVRTVLSALSSRQITLAKASDYLDGLKIKDLHQLEKLYAGA